MIFGYRFRAFRVRTAHGVRSVVMQSVKNLRFIENIIRNTEMPALRKICAVFPRRTAKSVSKRVSGRKPQNEGGEADGVA